MICRARRTSSHSSDCSDLLVEQQKILAKQPILTVVDVAVDVIDEDTVAK